MVKKLLLTAMLVCAGFTITGCATFQFFGGKDAKEGESEIIINIGSTIYSGKYNVFLNGFTRNSVKNKGGTLKYVVPNGEHIIMIVWEETYGTSTDVTSIQISAYSSRTILFAVKPNDSEKMEIVLIGTADLPQTPEQ